MAQAIPFFLYLAKNKALHLAMQGFGTP